VSEFAALGTALSGLYAQRAGLETTGRNIAGLSTDGYSRQRVELVSVDGSTQPAIWSRSSGVGGGVEVAGTTRMRDAFLEVRAQRETGARESLGTRATMLGDLEATFGEPGDTGLQSALASFWNSWDDVAAHPDQGAPRQQVLERAGAVVDGFNRVSQGLSDSWTALRDQAGTLVTEVNSAAEQVASLNGAIRAATAAGLSPNGLQDQRDVLVQKLAGLTGATSRAGTDGTVDVLVSGGVLVQGDRASALALSGVTDLGNVTTGTAAVQLTWARDGSPAPVSGGTLDGLVQGLTTVLPSYRDGLDAVAANLASAVNALHATGTDQDGLGGGPLFSGTTAGSLSVAFTDPRKLAAASGPGVVDGSTAAAMAELGSATGGADAAYRALVVRLGVETQSSTQRLKVQTAVAAQVDAARESVSGVDLDQEMTNMLSFQRAYEGAARMITAVDQVLDTLINRTGLVGR
jgi:flagellar hook-associated protein 1 FlgK